MEKTDLAFLGNKKRPWVLIIVVGVFLFLATTITPADNDGTSYMEPSYVKITVGEADIVAEIADTNTKRTRGLSGRNILEGNEGMLFVFEKPDHYGFWMKEMNFPIDIIWIGEDMRVRGITEHISPDTYPEVFYPPAEVRFVLETSAGFARSHDIKNGDLLLVRQ